jgi:dihydroceramidase
MQDYNITFYCAEAVNTITNLVFMWLGFKGLRNVIKYNHSPVFILAFLGYIVVGLGSIAFHTSLKCMSCRALFIPGLRLCAAV